MHIRDLVAITLLASPCGLTAQRLPLPRIGRGAASPQPAAPPPEIPTVARALAYRRSRWSFESYSLISSIQAPSGVGGSASYTTFGAGTHGDYRYTDHFSATFDLTASLPDGSATAETVEVGTRYSPLSWDQALRPFFDVRAAYIRLSDPFATPVDPSIGGSNQQFADGQQYSRGFGSVGGAGVEYTLTRSLALTSELSAMRNRMTTYHLTGLTTIPSGTSFWMTSFRYTLGFKLSPVRTLHEAQKTTS